MSEMSRRYCGSAFQSVGPAMPKLAKALLPAMVDRVNGTHNRLCVLLGAQASRWDIWHN